MVNIFRKTRGWKLPALAVLAVLFAAFTVANRKTLPATPPETLPPSASFKSDVSGIGVVEPKSELISIGVELPGVVREVHVKVGDMVKAGDPLFSLDQRDIDAQVQTLQATLKVAEAQAEEATAQLAILENLEDKRAVAKDEFNRRKFTKQTAFAHIDETKAQIEQALTTKERQTVRAPIDGEILEVNVRPGEYASAGALTSPLIRMGDVSTLYVRVEFDEQKAERVTPAENAEGYRRGDTEHSIPLTFVRFEPYVRPKQNLAIVNQRVDTRVLQVIYALPQGQNNIFVGQQMDVFVSSNK